MGSSACVFILEMTENHCEFWSLLDSASCSLPWRPEPSCDCVSLSEARDKILHVMQQQWYEALLLYRLKQIDTVTSLYLNGVKKL